MADMPDDMMTSLCIHSQHYTHPTYQTLNMVNLNV